MATYKLFDFLNDLNHEKKNIMENDPSAERDYSPWIINVGMSLQPDTVLYANDMNINYHLSKKMQYDYYIHGVRARKRYSKWPKKNKVPKDVEIIKKVFMINSSRAIEYINMMDPDVLKSIIKTHTTFGGTK